MNILNDGYTLMHEHMTLDLSRIKQEEDCRLDCKEETIRECRQLYELGVRNIVDVTNTGMGQNVPYVEEVERRTGIRILQSAGYYKEPFFPKEVYTQSVEELAENMADQVLNGFKESNSKSALLGEIGTSAEAIRDSECKVLDAAVLAHKKTKVPIYTHTTKGVYAKEQAEYLVSQGVDPGKLVIGHVDLIGRIDYIRAVLRQGVFVGFDTIGKENYLLDEKRAALLYELDQEGLLAQVVLSMDITRKSGLRYKGGRGYMYLFTHFLPMLRDAGIQESHIRQMLVDNPQRIFS